MKKIILILLLALITPMASIAQKHAPRPQPVNKNLPGIYPEGSERLLRVSDIEGLNSWDLKVMRNEIYARHGYIFKTDEIKRYFNEQSWYNPKYSNVENLLTEIEKKNIQFIKSYE